MKIKLYQFLNYLWFYNLLKDYYINLFHKKKIIKDLNIKDDIIIITSIIPFDKMKQRPQHIATALSNIYKNKTIIYYEIDLWNYNFSYKKINNLIITNSLLKIKNNIKNKNINVIATWSIKIPQIFKYLWLKYNKIIFDYYDNLDWYSNIMYKYLIKTLNKYNKIICSAKLLEEQLIDHWHNKDKVIYLPNGVNSSDWNINDKNKIWKIKNKYFNDNKKIIWFYWWIEHWLDYNLIKFIIKENPDKKFVFIWPDKQELLKKNEILNFKNVMYLWYINFKELKYYSYFFDVGIIPFKINKITDAVSPVKFFEYLIQWKPVVSTWFKEILYHKQYCFIANNYNDFNKKIQLALEKSNDNNYINSIKEYCKNYEWELLVKKIF